MRSVYYVRFENSPDAHSDSVFEGTKTACLKYLKDNNLLRAQKQGKPFGDQGIPRLGYYID